MSILDTYGLQDLTMRRLASQLGVKAGALYWHFASKQELLDALAAEVMADLPGLVGPNWQQSVHSWAIRLHTRLRSHRSGADLVAGVLALRSWQDSPGAQVEAYLVGQGIEQGLAHTTAAGVVHLVLGHASHEEQIQQLVDLGVRSERVPDDSAQLLDDAIWLLILGVALKASDVNQ